MQMQNVTVLVSENLDFNVLGLTDEFFEKNGAIAEGACGFRLRFIQQFVQILRFPDNAHAAAAATKSRLDNQGKSDFFGNGHRLLAITDGLIRAFENRDLYRARHFAGGCLVAHHVEDLRFWADEDDAGIGAGLRERRVFRQEAVAWVDGIDAFFFGESDDALDVEIRSERAFFFIQLVGFIGFEAVRAKPILGGIDGHGANAQFSRRAHDANGDLTAVGHHQFFDGADG